MYNHFWTKVITQWSALLSTVYIVRCKQIMPANHLEQLSCQESLYVKVPC